jgi:uncharacterized LabA/DUF88 family protein
MSGRPYPVSTAILVDLAFFIHRYPRVYGSLDFDEPDRTAKEVAARLYEMALKHLNEKVGEKWVRVHHFYRLFVYDCPPMEKRVHNPVSRKAIVLAETPTARFRKALHQELRGKRKVALRLGYLDEANASWQPKPVVLEEILKGRRSLQTNPLREDEVLYYAKQKGVDMRIGLDIASMAYKKQVSRIVLVAGDSDFVPAAKMARREGIDFILDPMWNPIKPDLHEHIDGLQSTSPKPGYNKE